jgi:hypothetical protein
MRGWRFDRGLRAFDMGAEIASTTCGAVTIAVTGRLTEAEPAGMRG